MRRLFLTLASFALALAPLSVGAQSAPAAGSLIKGSGPSVYYLGLDNKRYVFPNEKTYFTWYGNFDSVVSVSDAMLASFPLGGNVTYRPGTRMLKVESDPRVYAVASNGTLRWVETEPVARDLYGETWNTMIDDISAAFFVSYVLGDAITAASQFDRTEARDSATSIGVDKRLETPTEPEPEPTPEPTPEPEPTRTGTLTHVPDNIGLGQAFTLIANANPSTALWYIDIWVDGVHMRHCEYSPCGADLTFPTSQSSLVGVAKFVWGDGVTYHTTSTIEAMSSSDDITVRMPPEIKAGSLHEIIVDVDASFVANTIDIYIDGNSVRGCNGVQQCRYLGSDANALGTTHSVYAVARDANGFTRQSQTSSYSVVSNPKPTLEIRVGKTTMLSGESVEVTAEAFDDDGIVSTKISTDDGTLIKECQTSRCTATVTRTQSGNFFFVAEAEDALNAVGTGSSEVIVVQ